MSSNLDELFKTDANLEKDGIWFRVNENVRFRIRRFGGKNSQKLKLAMAKFHKPKARLIELDQLSTEETDLIMAKVFCDACLISWEGVELDGQEVECNFENGVKLFTRLPELFNSLFKYSQDFESFKEDLGNS